MVLLKTRQGQKFHLNKEPEVSNKEGDSVEEKSGFQMNKRSHLNKESGVHIEQGVSAEQGERGLK